MILQDMSAAWRKDDHEPMSPASSSSSMDEEDVNCRVSPHWPDYRSLLLSKGFRLDTVRDVKQYYCDHFADGVNRLPSRQGRAYHMETMLSVRMPASTCCR